MDTSDHADSLAAEVPPIPAPDDFRADIDIDAMPDWTAFVPVQSSFNGVVVQGGGSDDTLVGTNGADYLLGLPAMT